MRLISVPAFVQILPLNVLKPLNIKTHVSGLSLLTSIVMKAMRFECTTIIRISFILQFGETENCHV